METIARFGRANRLGDPDGVRNVSMSTSPSAVAMLVRAYPGSAGGPGGIANGIPKTRVPGAAGASCTVTTPPAPMVTVTGPSGVCAAYGMTAQVSLPGSQAVAAAAGDAVTAVRTPAVRLTASRSNATRRPVRWPGGLAGQLAAGDGMCGTRVSYSVTAPAGAGACDNGRVARRRAGSACDRPAGERAGSSALATSVVSGCSA